MGTDGQSSGNQKACRCIKLIADLKNLSVTFGGNEILKDINFKIEDNDRIGLIGANGAGKSTLLNVIYGNITEFDGELNLSGKRIGYLKQNPEIDGDLTIDEYLKSVFWFQQRNKWFVSFGIEDIVYVFKILNKTSNKNNK